MATPDRYMFEFKEVVEALVKQQGIHEGEWAIYFEYGLQAGNFGPSDSDLRPGALVPIIKMGLLRTEQKSNLSVDAAVVNPKSTKKVG